MRKGINKRASMLLAAVMLFAAVPEAAYGSSALSELRSKELLLNEQLSLHQSTFFNSNNQSKVAENYLVYEPGEDVSPMICYGSDIAGAASMNRVYNLETAAGNTIVAATNGDFFTMSTGISLGICIKEGIVRTSEHSTNESIGFTKDGEAIIGRPGLNIVFTDESSGMCYTKMGFNKSISKSTGFILYSSDFGDTNQASFATRNVIIDIDKGDASVGGTIKGTVTAVEDSTGNVTLKDDQLVLSIAKETQYTTALAAVSNMSAGDDVTIEFNISQDWAGVYNAMGVERRLITDGVVQTFSDASRAPRTAVGITRSGDVVLYTVDGRQSTHSMGLTYAELAERMHELGCTDAVNLDGGDSTQMFATYPGESGHKEIGKHSGSTLRSTGNYLVFKNNQTEIGTVKHLHIYPYGEVIMAGASVPVSALATDAHYYTVDAPEKGITYGVSKSSLGTISEDGLFTAGSKAMTGQITAKYNGVTGSADITVVTAPDSIAIVSKDTGLELSGSMSIAAGESYSFSGTAVYKMMSVISDPAGFTWSVSGDIGSIDKNGVFTATTTGRGSGTITAKAGSKTASISVSVVTEGVALDSFEQADKSVFPVAEYSNSQTAINTDLSYVHNGTQSYKVKYNYNNIGAHTTTDGAIVGITELSIPLGVKFTDKHPTMFSTWVYGDASDNRLQVSVATAGGIGTVELADMDFTGWRLATVQLPRGVTELIGLNIATPMNAVGSYTFYMDQFMVGYGYYMDTEAPEISASVADDGLVLTGTVKDNMDSAISKNDILVTYDGAPVGFTYSGDSKAITALLPQADGYVHHLIIKAEDESGNIARLSISVATAAPEGFESKPVFSDMGEGDWATIYAEYLYRNDIITGRPSGDSILYDPRAGMTRMEFAAVIVRWIGADTDAFGDVDLPFSDVGSIQSWAIPSVKTAVGMGFMTGKSAAGSSKVKFDPMGSISRQEVMTVIGRLQERGYETAEPDFNDKDSIAAWALPYVGTLVKQGVISGFDGKLNPTGAVTREQVAKIIFELN